MTARKPCDPRETGVLNHPPNMCLLCDGIRRQRYGLPQTGGRDVAPLPVDDPPEWSQGLDVDAEAV